MCPARSWHPTSPGHQSRWQCATNRLYSDEAQSHPGSVTPTNNQIRTAPASETHAASKPVSLHTFTKHNTILRKQRQHKAAHLTTAFHDAASEAAASCAPHRPRARPREHGVRAAWVLGRKVGSWLARHTHICSLSPMRPLRDVYTYIQTIIDSHGMTNVV